jgi:hypothetical protein
MALDHATVFKAPTAGDAALSEVVRPLVETYRPERVYLFGSVARGDAGPDRDYDIMVVVPDEAPPASSIADCTWPRPCRPLSFVREDCSMPHDPALVAEVRASRLPKLSSPPGSVCGPTNKETAHFRLTRFPDSFSPSPVFPRSLTKGGILAENSKRSGMCL